MPSIKYQLLCRLVQATCRRQYHGYCWCSHSTHSQILPGCSPRMWLQQCKYVHICIDCYTSWSIVSGMTPRKLTQRNTKEVGPGTSSGKSRAPPPVTSASQGPPFPKTSPALCSFPTSCWVTVNPILPLFLACWKLWNKQQEYCVCFVCVCVRVCVCRHMHVCVRQTIVPLSVYRILPHILCSIFWSNSIAHKPNLFYRPSFSFFLPINLDIYRTLSSNLPTYVSSIVAISLSFRLSGPLSISDQGKQPNSTVPC